MWNATGLIMAFLLDHSAFLPLVPLSLASLAVTLTWLILRSWKSHLKNLPYPPGPPERNSLFGNLGDLPTASPWFTYTRWANMYGDIVHFRALGQHTIVLNSIEAVDDLLEKRSSIYSSRPHVKMLDLMGWMFTGAFKPYGPEWRRHRRFFQYAFRSAVSPNLRPITTKKVNDMLYNLLLSPEDFMNHYKTVAAANIMAIVYGHDIASKDDYFVSLSEAAVRQLSWSVFPGAIVVNAFPILSNLPEWFPGTGFHKFARETKKLTDQMQEVPLDYVKKAMQTGDAPPSLASDLLTNFPSKEDARFIKEICASIYTAGSDTSASVLGTFFYAMATHPGIQKKAQQEIDDVVGPGRLVTVDDRESLPYVEALIRELVRWRPVLPIGLAHSTTREDTYKGFYIPKDAAVISNIWAISHDKRKFANPEQLNPERQFDDQGNLRDDYQNYVFGFGRRICPGRHLAFDLQWLTTASILSLFDISPKKDSSGNDIPILGEYSPGLVSHPEPFECTIKPRSSEAERLIRKAVGFD